MGKRQDLTGLKFNRLTFIEYVYSTEKSTYWKCLCDCGNTKVLQSTRVKRGETRSCGCYRSVARTKHGYSRHPLYEVWKNIIDRCEKASSDSIYGKNYRARGITVCSEWRNDLKVFIEWGLANRWEPGLQIDRIDNNGNYCPENCRFVTRKQNNRNKRNNRYLTYNDQTKTVSEWAEELGVHPDLLHNRLRRNWTIEKTLTTTIETKNQKNNRKHL